jgi:hypothetical protein
LRTANTGASSPEKLERRLCRPYCHEWPTAHEVCNGAIGAKVVPAEDPGEEAQSPWMPPSKIGRYREAFVLREEALLRCE